MCESATQRPQLDEQAHLRNLAMQLAVQMQPYCHNTQEVRTVLRYLDELIEWQYQPALKVVG